MVVCVRWCPGNEHRFVSCSFDGSVKLWDTRGKLPLHTVAGDDRMLAVDLHGPMRIASGGVDGSLRVYKLDEE
jgi:ribosome biogenesis protein YTM1